MRSKIRAFYSARQILLHYSRFTLKITSRCKHSPLILPLIAPPLEAHYTWKYPAERRSNPPNLNFRTENQERNQRSPASRKETQNVVPSHFSSRKMWLGIWLLTYFEASKGILGVRIILNWEYALPSNAFCAINIQCWQHWSWLGVWIWNQSFGISSGDVRMRIICCIIFGWNVYFW